MSAITPGQRLYSAVSSVEIIVVKPGTATAIACAGEAMTTVRPDAVTVSAAGAELELSKRYEDAESGLLVLCTKTGAGPVTVDGREVVALEAKPLPSSD